ncbi:MAG: 50S ribosomal protein L5, partial [Thermoplasmata archaeon]|nr:50S ribosomal protein L5 [Thermoplasmata archaeon]
FSFGVQDYTDFPGMKYDPEIGIFGLDVSVVLSRPGKRVKLRRIMRRHLPKHHKITKREGMQFIESTFNTEVVE